MELVQAAHKLTETAEQVRKGLGNQPIPECRGALETGPRDLIGTEGQQESEAKA